MNADFSEDARLTWRLAWRLARLVAHDPYHDPANSRDDDLLALAEVSGHARARGLDVLWYPLRTRACFVEFDI